jgi:hypothetical protein
MAFQYLYETQQYVDVISRGHDEWPGSGDRETRTLKSLTGKTDAAACISKLGIVTSLAVRHGNHVQPTQQRLGDGALSETRRLTRHCLHQVRNFQYRDSVEYSVSASSRRQETVDVAKGALAVNNIFYLQHRLTNQSDFVRDQSMCTLMSDP